MTKEAESQQIRSRLRSLPFSLRMLDELVADKAIQFRFRGIDTGWHRFERLTVGVGFNPLLRELYIPRESPLGRWCTKENARDVRKLNQNDGLVYQLLFLLHDYLHLWGYGVIYDALPRKHHFLDGKITPANFDAHVFCQLVSEAVATVGLAYWWLSTTRLEDEMRVGTCIDHLTVTYHTKNDAEHRRFYTRARHDFETQRPSFFSDIATFYCTGAFLGFGRDDITRSPLLSRWLSHEVTYGETQRRYSRQWFQFLRDNAAVEANASTAAVSLREPWKRQLIADVGNALWAKVKGTDHCPTPAYPRLVLQERPAIDLRFVNCRNEKELRAAATDPFVRKHQRNLWLAQTLARKRMDSTTESAIGDLRKLCKIDVWEPITAFVRDFEQVNEAKYEPRHLFQLG